MSVLLFTPPKAQFLDGNGDPLASGKVNFYEVGTATPKDTYTDKAKTTPSANPVILDARGEAAIWLDGSYKVVVTDSLDVEIYTQDNVSQEGVTSITSEWLSPGHTGTYISGTSFSVETDQTSLYHVGRRIKLVVTAGTVYGVIVGSAYTTLTTIDVLLDDSAAVDSGLSDVDIGILGFDNHAYPEVHNAVVTKTANYTAIASDHTILMDPTSGTLTMTLPTAVGIAGKVYVIKKINGGLNPVTVTPDGSETIEGDATFPLGMEHHSIEIASDGVNWDIVSEYYHSIKTQRGADVVSESILFTTNGFPTDGGGWDITGTTGITGILAADDELGSIIILQFDDIVTLTHHATNLVLPLGLDMTTKAGDILIFQEYGVAQWRLLTGSTIPVGGVDTAQLVDESVTGVKLGYMFHQAWFAAYNVADIMISGIEGVGDVGTLAEVIVTGGLAEEAHDSVNPKLWLSVDAGASSIHLTSGTSGSGAVQSQHNWGAKATIYSDGSEIQDMNIMFGFATTPVTVMADPTPDDDCAMLRYATEEGDANWYGVTCDGTWSTGSQAQDTGVVVATATKYELEVAVTGTSAVFTVNGTEITNTTKVPTLTQGMELFIGVESKNSAGAKRGFYLSHLELYKNK